ncbi:MAG TPA: NAD-binding protein [Mycobacterium sp.]
MRASRWRLRGDDDSAAQPGYALVGVLHAPQRQVSPAAIVWRRIGIAVAALVVSTFCVYLDRDGYQDVRGGQLTLLDCMYYSAVTLSTTGYGDITPVSEFARLVNVLVITPLRVVFLILLVGTTFEAFTQESRQAFKIQRWRKKVPNPTVVIGYGTKGRTAIDVMLGDQVALADIVVVDSDAGARKRADAAGLFTVDGDATKSDVLRKANVQNASSVIVAVDDDATAVLATLTAREIAPRNTKIVASIREAENQHLLQQSGADSVVVSSETTGRLLGIATATPKVVEAIEDLLTPGEGLAIAEREVDQAEVGGSPRHLRDIVLGVVRGGQFLRVGDPKVDSIESDDRLLYVRNVSH